MTDQAKVSQTSDRPIIYWLVFKWLLVIAVLVAVLYLGTLPARSKLSTQHLYRGDKLLEERKYLSARLEYRKALVLDKNNTKAAEHEFLANEASSDITKLEKFLRDRGADNQLNTMKEAKAVPDNEVAAAQTSRELLEAGEYQLAIIPAKTAVQMDKSYRDGWLYLSIASLESSRQLEIAQETRQEYLDQARLALEKAAIADPSYEPIKQIEKELNS